MKSQFSLQGYLWLSLALIILLTILFGLKQILKRSALPEQKKKSLLNRTLVVLGAWVALLTILSLKGFFTNFSVLPPRPILAVLLPLPIILLISFSKTGKELLKNIPSHWLVFMQSFRIFVEVLLWMGFISNKLPVQMSFEGRNFDILIGLLALPAGYLLLKRKASESAVVIVFNVLGIALLLNIVIIAILSMPTSFRYFMNEPSNEILANFPFIVLPGVLVPIAYSIHIFSLRQLFIKRKSIQQ